MQRSATVRRRFTAAERAKLLVAYHEGDRTQREFASRNGISVSCLSNWLRKSRVKRPDEAVPSFIQMPGGWPMAGGSRAAFKILFPAGHILEIAAGFHAEELAPLCQVVRGL